MSAPVIFAPIYIGAADFFMFSICFTYIEVANLSAASLIEEYGLIFYNGVTNSQEKCKNPYQTLQNLL